jgi:hypothetical protein
MIALAVLCTTRQESATSEARWKAKICCCILVPSSSAKTHVGQAEFLNSTMRDAPSGCTMLGAYNCEDNDQVPLAVLTAASKPLTRTIRPAGGFVAVSSSA